MTAASEKRLGDLALEAQALGIDVVAVTNAALRTAIDVAQRETWLEKYKDALRAQDEWIDMNGHPFADIAAGQLADAAKKG